MACKGQCEFSVKVNDIRFEEPTVKGRTWLRVSMTVQGKRVLPEVRNPNKDAETVCKKSVAVRGRRIQKKAHGTPLRYIV